MRDVRRDVVGLDEDSLRQLEHVGRGALRVERLVARLVEVVERDLRIVGRPTNHEAPMREATS
jgi:hypothetical protein